MKTKTNIKLKEILRELVGSTEELIDYAQVDLDIAMGEDDDIEDFPIAVTIKEARNIIEKAETILG